MTNTSNLKARLADGEPGVGCWLHLVSPIAAEIVSQAGYDCVMIDLEHGPTSLTEAVGLMQAVQGRDCAPLIRVPSNDPVALKRALDIGPVGVMVPGVNSAEEATAAVSACHYPPEGTRGMAPIIVRAANYGHEWRDYVGRANAELMVICQIETGIAVERAAEIAAVPGVDMIFIGPFDLSADLGHLGAPDHPEVRESILRVEQASKAAGKLLSGIPTPERDAAQLFADGYDLVLSDFDLIMLRDAARASVERLRRATAG